MAAVIICSDFGAQENKVYHFSIVSQSICLEVMGPKAMIFIFWMLSFKSALTLSSLTFRRLFSSSALPAIRVVSYVYLRLLIFPLAVWIPDCDSSSLVFHMMYLAFKLNKQGDNMEPWHLPFTILNQSVVPSLGLTAASWTAYRCHRRCVKWNGIHLFKNFPQFVVNHTVKGLNIVNEVEVDVLLEFSCFFYDPMNVGNLTSASLTFLNPACTIWKIVCSHILKA